MPRSRAGSAACAAIIVLLSAYAQPSFGQSSAVRTVDESASGVTIEMTATWPLTLRQTVDSLAASHFSDEVAAALSYGWLTTSELVQLPTLVPPTVRVVSADYDEIRLPLTNDGDVPEWLLEQLGRPAAYDAGIGLERRRPVSTIAFQALTYDPATGSLRRYRRVVAAVDYPAVDGEATPSPMIRARSAQRAVAQSALADGIVFKIPVREEGVFRIDHAMLERLLDGVASVGDVDPGEIKILGNGGAPLPAIAGAPRPTDLIENPILVQGGADGSFDSGDGIIFYAKAANGWTFDEEAGAWDHYVNPFSNDNYYFLKIGGGTGRRIATDAFPGLASADAVSRVEGRLFVQPDEFMWAKSSGSGLTWVSRRIEANGELKVLDRRPVPGLAAGTVRYEARAAIRSNPRTAVRFYAGDADVGRLLASRAIGDGDLTPIAAAVEGTFEHTISGGGELNLSMRLESGTNSPSAALEWLRAFYPQDLRAQGGYLRFATPAGADGPMDLIMSGFSSAPTVLDVTDPGNVRALEVRASGNAHRVQVDASAGARPREVVAFTPSAVRSLTTALEDWSLAATRVAPQNLHGVSGYPEFVLITPSEFRSAADQLADHRRAEGLDVRVVDIEQIYNEFSGGLVDMRAVRDYLKFLYDRGPSREPALKYALLVGDGHYNFRGITADGQPPVLKNWVPSYQTDDTYDPIRSYTSDDYFALLDDAEGEWPYAGETVAAPSGSVVERVDLGIGRLPVQTAQDANVVVQKIIDYEKPSTYGAWRSQYTFLADDGLTGLTASSNDFDLHTQNADAVATLLDSEYPQVNIKKIYAQSHQREYLGGWRIPTAKQDVISALNRGTLVFNYSGHGNAEALMQEQVFVRSDVTKLTNRDRPSIFVTATCDFGRWDMIDRQSTAEDLLLYEGGGSVALLTTVRLVFTSSNIFSLNVGLNRELNRELFKTDEEGLPRRLGDALRSTKNTDIGLQGNNRKFNLLGDPTMRIGLPTTNVAVEEVNGVAVEEEQAPMRALERVTLRGSVRDVQNMIDTGFNGQVDLTVFDAERRVPVVDQRRMSTPYYTVREDLIWRGIAHVQDGRYEATFVVPKDISYRNDTGRISAYAFSNEDHALGQTANVVVGGTAPNPEDDGSGPQIELFLNDTTYVSGGIVAPNPLLIVKLFDASGINTVGAGVGHEMLLVLDDKEQDFVDLSRYYESEPGSYQRGSVSYRLDRELEPGTHSLSVRAWDVANNSSTERLDFFVGESERLSLRNVFNYPNPTSGRTRFTFEHNLPVGTPARVQVRIYTVNGLPVRTLDTDEALPAGMLTGSTVQIPWDGRDEDLGLLASGVYLYRLRVEAEAPDGEKQVSEHIDRIAIIR